MPKTKSPKNVFLAVRKTDYGMYHLVSCHSSQKAAEDALNQFVRDHAKNKSMEFDGALRQLACKWAVEMHEIDGRLAAETEIYPQESN